MQKMKMMNAFFLPPCCASFPLPLYTDRIAQNQKQTKCWHEELQESVNTTKYWKKMQMQNIEKKMELQ